MNYHPWVKVHGLNLPDPVPVETLNEVVIDGKNFRLALVFMTVQLHWHHIFQAVKESSF